MPHFSALVRPQYCFQAWGLQHKKDAELLERAMKMVRGLEPVLYQERLRELGSFSSEKALGRPSSAGGELKKRREIGFLHIQYDKMEEGGGFKLKEWRFRLDVAS